MSEDLDVRIRFSVEDEVLSGLQARASGSGRTAAEPWANRLDRHSLTWVGAFASDRLVGFVHACWDGGSHAFLLDTAVDPDRQRQGIGRIVVHALVEEVRAAGCEWLHVDYERHLDSFYRSACGFRRTEAGLIRLTG